MFSAERAADTARKTRAKDGGSRILAERAAANFNFLVTKTSYSLMVVSSGRCFKYQ